MSFDIKVSVIVPVYNVERYLKKCLDSLVAQTLEAIEIIVVNDGSPDNSQTIIDKFAKEHPEKIIALRQENKGLGPARNFGVKHSRGEYIGFVDSDDWVAPDMYELLYENALSQGSDVAMCDICFVSESDGKHSVAEAFGNESSKPDAVTEFILACTNLPGAWNKIYKRGLFEKVLFPNYIYEDVATIPVILSHCGKISCITKPLYYYLRREGSITTSESSPKNLDVIKAWERCLTESNLRYEKEIAYAVYFSICTFMGVKGEYLSEYLEFFRENIKRFTGNEYIEKAVRCNFDNIVDLFKYTQPPQCADIVKPEEIVAQAVVNEHAQRVLEISGFDSSYGRMIKSLPGQITGGNPRQGISVDRVDLTGSLADDGVYDNVFDAGILDGIEKMERYDVAVIFHLFENTESATAKALLERLLKKVNKQVLVMTTEYPYDLTTSDENRNADVRAYHPLFFIGMDFSYKMLETADGALQAYSFFPKIDYEPLPCDILPSGDSSDDFAHTDRKLNIGYIIIHHRLTGALKAMFSQMKELTKRGHHTTAYFRSAAAGSALPQWCGLTNGDISRQVVVPDGEGYLDYVKDEDVIILSWLEMAEEFAKCEIPVVLWEQGTPALYGNHSHLVSSGSAVRKSLHQIYRTPINLLAVSHTVQAILKGVYNRQSQIFPAAIDTDVYYPASDKNNDIPVILLVGQPKLEFKGIGFAFGVLEAAFAQKMAFNVRLVMATDVVELPRFSFPLEKIVSPPQERLAEIYRNADILISPSLYESFGLPPLEAMASGTAVIATDCGGINAYAEPGVNCLLCEQGDVSSMVYALMLLLQNPDVRSSLAKAGRETALRFNFSSIIPKLEVCLHKIIGNDGINAG